MKRAVGLVLLVGCGGPRDPIVWMEGGSYEWVHFNHRLSHLELRVDDREVRASIVGGTSTTGVDASLPAECDPAACEELPFIDEALVSVDWARADDPDAVAAAGTVELTADADGESAELSLNLPKGSGDEATAVIRGIRWSSSHPLDGGPSCYDPAFGWLPTTLEVALGEPKVDGERVVVEVTAKFTAGYTLEEFRACVDEVIARARAALEVDVLVVSGGGATDRVEVTGSASWSLGGGALNPEPQILPDPQKVKLDLEDPLVGWSRLAWTFHEGDPDGRGAYLRRLEWGASPTEARGAATNYSPITQLSGFTYGFEGTVVGHEVGGTLTRKRVSTTIPVVLQDDRAPEVHVIDSTRG